MYYPQWVRLPRPRHFPEDPRLVRLVASYAATIEGFTLRMKRRNARDLRKGIFGPKGIRTVPGGDGGVREFALPRGWTLRLTYHETFWFEAGDVSAEFIPPVIQEARSIPQREPAYLAEAA